MKFEKSVRQNGNVTAMKLKTSSESTQMATVKSKFFI